MGYIYILQYKRSGKFKIGYTAKRPKGRPEEINESIRGEVRPIGVWRVGNALKHERRLHRKWSTERFTFRGSGKTEWFRLNWLELAFVIIDLELLRLWQRYLRWVFLLGFMLIIAYFALNA